MTRASLKNEILHSIQNIPMLSPVASRLLAYNGDPKHGLDDMVRVVKTDAVLTGRLLKTVNSPVYARTVSITGVERALALLGDDMVISLALEVAASAVFRKEMPGYQAGQQDLWRHNLKTAIAAKKLAAYCLEPQSSEIAFTAGLLHDLGKTVLSGWLDSAPEQKDIINNIEKGRFRDFLSAEEDILGLTHAEAGHAMTIHWRLPGLLPEIIRFHHHPSQAPQQCKALTYLVHLGDALAMMGGSGTGTDSLRYHMDKDFSDFIVINEDELALVFLEVEEEFQNTLASLAD